MKALPSPGGAAERDLAAEQPDQLAADRQAQSGAAVLAGRGAVGLREGLEHARLELGRDADAGVGDGERGDRTAARASVSLAALQPLSAMPTCTLTAPCSVNLNALESRFFSTWRRRPGSVAMLDGSSGAELHREGDALLVGDMAEVALQPALQLGHAAAR